MHDQALFFARVPTNLSNQPAFKPVQAYKVAAAYWHALARLLSIIYTDSPHFTLYPRVIVRVFLPHAPMVDAEQHPAWQAHF